MNRTDPEPGRPRGFTLVELVTVMGILAVLMTLVIGAVQGVRGRMAREATIQMIGALDAALQAYYADWGKYPWTNESVPPEVAHLMGTVDDTVGTGYAPVSFSSSAPNKTEAMLYAALNMQQRHGPYMAGGTGQVAVKSFGAQKFYRVYTDGWGRPILYLPPERGAGATPDREVSVPLLVSEGARQNFDADPKTKDDDIRNYDLRKR
jgi:prepilin-type N-terminal cleavage/methylation domain-containing protein